MTEAAGSSLNSEWHSGWIPACTGMRGVGRRGAGITEVAPFDKLRVSGLGMGMPRCYTETRGRLRSFHVAVVAV